MHVSHLTLLVAGVCTAAANDFFNMGVMSQIPWRFARSPSGQTPPAGGFPLPVSAAPLGCMVRLDVLSDPNAADRFALIQIAADFVRIMNKCVRPHPSYPTSGFVAVGPRKVLKLSISPTPMDVLLESESILNGTGLQS